MSDPMTPETPDPPPVSPDPWKDIRGDVTYTVAEIATWQDVRLHDMTRAPKCWSSTERSFACQIDFLLRARAADALRHQQQTSRYIARIEQLLARLEKYGITEENA